MAQIRDAQHSLQKLIKNTNEAGFVLLGRRVRQIISSGISAENPWFRTDIRFIRKEKTGPQA